MQVADNVAWVEANFGQVDLRDKRLDKRLQILASNALKQPQGSIVAQNVSWADTKAAYRFYDNVNVTFDNVCDQHWQQTRQTLPGRFLLICDTTEIDHTSHKATAGLGMLGNGKGRGLQLHSCLMYDSVAKQLVGAAGAAIHYRKAAPKNETEMQRLNRLRESHVWGTLADQVGSAPDGCQWIHVWDRGGDNFEAMCHILLTKNEFVVRAGRLNRTVFNSEGESTPLQKAIEEARDLGGYDIHLRAHEKEPARNAKIEVSVVRVTFPRPRHHSKWVKDCQVKAITVNVVIARELAPPKGRKRTFWVLLTTLPVSSLADALQVIQDYEDRWLIEEYHKVIKSGCSIQIHALQTADRLEPLVGLLSVIGTRILQLKLIGRNQPEAKAKTHIPSHWIEAMQLSRPRINFDNMTAYHFLREIAKLGGFLARKGDGEPGWVTIWRGMEFLMQLIDGINLGRNAK